MLIQTTSPAATFRLFLSSTFADWHDERNYLQTHVWPELTRECAHQGFGFQVIDLRWGISEAAARAGKVMEVCLGEIDRCQTIAPRPNFLLLVGDRYGYRPLPEQIPHTDFQSILRSCNDDEQRLLAGAAGADGWYIHDLNCTRQPDGVWCLNRQRLGESQGDWDEAEPMLRAILERTTNGWALQRRADIGIGFSATEMEYLRAIRGAAHSSEVLAMCRTLTDVPSPAQDPAAAAYGDYLPDGTPDTFAREASQRWRRRVNDEATVIEVHTIPWTARAEARYLERFAKGVLTSVRRSMAESLRDGTPQASVSDTEMSAVIDWHRLETLLLTHFLGRGRLIAETGELARNSHGPVAIIGGSGAGKSAFMAQLRKHLAFHYPDAHQVVAYCGHHPLGSSETVIMTSLCAALGKNIAAGEKQNPVDLFHEALGAAAQNKQLWVLVDAVDQLTNTTGEPAFLDWLSRHLPTGVCMVITCHADLSERLPKALQKQTLEALSVQQARNAAEARITAAGRHLTDTQWAVVHTAFQSCTNPLYVQTIAVMASGWASYHAPASLPVTLPELLGAELERLSAPERHGRALVHRVLAYLLNARYPIPEQELLELVSRDHEVWAEFLERARHQPPLQRLPDAVWSRLLLDLRPWLRESSAVGAGAGSEGSGSGFQIVHRAFAEVCVGRCLPSRKVRHATHEQMAAYFQQLLDAIPEDIEKEHPRTRSYLAQIGWHLFRAQNYAALARFLGSERLLRSLWMTWDARHQEVVHYWKKIELETSLRAPDFYREIVSRPNPASFDAVVILQIYEQLNHNEAALDAIEALLHMCEVMGNVSDRCDYLRTKARIQLELGNTSEAEATLLELDAHQREHYNPEGIRKRLRESMGMSDEELETLLGPTNLDAMDTEYERVSTIGQQAYLAEQKEDYETALTLHRRAGELYRRNNHPEGELMALTNEGRVLATMGDAAGAAAVFERGLVLARQLGNQAEVANLLNFRAQLFYMAGEFTPILPLLQEAAHLLLRVGQPASLHMTLGRLGDLLMQLGQQNAAIATMQKFLHEAELTGDEERIGICQRAVMRVFSPVLAGGASMEEDHAQDLMARGLELVEETEYAQAIVLLEKAEMLFRKHGNIRCARKCLHERSITMRLMGQEPTQDMIRQEVLDMMGIQLPPNE